MKNSHLKKSNLEKLEESVESIGKSVNSHNITNSDN